MDFLARSLLWLGTHFSTEAYLLSTKVQGLLWSAADILLVLAFLRIADVLRSRHGVRPIRTRYLLLAATAVLTPALAFAPTSRWILILESVICGGQFLILAATLLLERTRLLGLVRELGRGAFFS